MVRVDKHGVRIPGLYEFRDPASAALPRIDDEHRGPAVNDAYELSRCYFDLREMLRNLPLPAEVPANLLQGYQAVSEDRREEWLRVNWGAEEAARMISRVMRQEELAVWVMPDTGTEQLVAPSALVAVDKDTLTAGCYRSPDCRGWLHGRPLFIKKTDWVRFKLELADALGLAEVGISDQELETLADSTPGLESATPKRTERAASFKKGPPPADEQILAKADEMKARGMDGYDIAKNMRLEPGFESTPTVLVRQLIRGRYKPTGRPS